MLKFRVLVIAFWTGAAAIPLASVAADEPAVAEKPPASRQTVEKPALTKPIAELVADLSSDRFVVRQEATQQLMRAGRQVVGPLSIAAGDGTPETAVRAIGILERLYIAGDDATAESVGVALEKLAGSTTAAVAVRATDVLQRNDDIRTRRAVAEIKRLGGVVNYGDPRTVVWPAGGVRPNQTSIAYVLLGQTWTGGDEGLKHVKRLTELQTVYYVEGALSRKAAQDLQASGLAVHARGKAFLGIGGGPHPNGCLVQVVKPGSAAADAGLRPGDVISSFGSKPVPTFDRLIELIKNYAPGDKVETEVIRGARAMTVEVKMGAWRN